MNLPNIDLQGSPFFLNEEDLTWLTRTFAGMTEEEKIEQLFFPALFDFDEAVIDDILKKIQPSGFMYRPCDTETAIRTGRMLREKCGIPPLIAANLEKGGDGIVFEGTMIGSPMAVAATDDIENERHLARACAREARAVGANWAFAPVIDIDYNYRNPIMNTRTLGSAPEKVAAFGRAFTEECQKEGVAVAIKHFPGDGRDDRDQHLVTTINDMSCEEWMETYGKCYRESIEAGALTVMVGHIMQPAWQKRLNPSLKDNQILPATLSQELIGKKGLLRGVLGFNGLIATDASTMAGMMIPMERERAVPYAIACGADIFLFNRNLEEDLEYMRMGVAKGVITRERLDEAVCRILALKASLKLYKKTAEELAPERAKTVLGCEQHKVWAREIADQAITLVKEEPGVLPLDPVNKKRLLLIPMEPDLGFAATAYASQASPSQYFREAMEREGFEVTIYEPSPLFEGKTDRSSEMKKQYDCIIYLAKYSTKSNQTTVRIEWAQPMGANCPLYVTAIPTIFISLENPYHLQDVPRVRTYINTYGASRTSVDALVEKLLGRSTFKGKSPVDAFCGRWDTHLM